MTTKFRPGIRRRPRRHAKPLGPILAAAALAMVVAACSSVAGGAPSFTYAPVPSAGSMPGMDMSPSASAPPASAAPLAKAPATSTAPAGSQPASATPPPGSPVANGATLHIAAQNIEFDTNHLDAPAGQAFTLEFDNNDPGIPHNVEIKDASGASRFKGQIVTGPMKVSYQIPALEAGTYMFVCDVHPNMTGTLTVK
jgi:plastocyanin